MDDWVYRVYCYLFLSYDLPGKATANDQFCQFDMKTCCHIAGVGQESHSLPVWSSTYLSNTPSGYCGPQQSGVRVSSLSPIWILTIL